MKTLLPIFFAAVALASVAGLLTMTGYYAGVQDGTFGERRRLYNEAQEWYAKRPPSPKVLTVAPMTREEWAAQGLPPVRFDMWPKAAGALCDCGGPLCDCAPGTDCDRPRHCQHAAAELLPRPRQVGECCAK